MGNIRIPTNLYHANNVFSFGFLTVDDLDKAEGLVEEFHSLQFKGRKMCVQVAYSNRHRYQQPATTTDPANKVSLIGKIIVKQNVLLTALVQKQY